MTLFNARLGAWLPNPACATTADLKQAKPPNAVVTLGREMLGLTNDRHSAVYLSDGGHFDNLGLYEMLRRRCRYILVIDAGEDPDAAFADLGSALRKAAIDFSVEVDFAHVGIGTRDHPLDSPIASALGRIRYFEPEAAGYLLYLKPSYWNEMPMDVRAYASAHLAFPHESTLDQWFTESQFESYRHLGEYLMEGVGEQTAHDLAAFFQSVKTTDEHG
jgi:hypothetical protein